MASLTVSDLRTRVAGLVDAVAGFSESKVPYPNFGHDPSSVSHLRFAVGATSTTPIQDRQRTTDGVTVQSSVSVLFSHRIKPKDQVVSYGDALDSEHAIIKAIMIESSSMREDLQCVLSDIPRRDIDPAGEWFLGEIRFIITHRLALA